MPTMPTDAYRCPPEICAPAQSIFWGVFWCGKRAARPAAAALCRICAVFISVIRSIRTPVKAHGNYISTRILALAPLNGII